MPSSTMCPNLQVKAGKRGAEVFLFVSLAPSSPSDLMEVPLQIGYPVLLFEFLL